MNETEFKTGVIRPVECMREGWELIKDEYWLFFAITLVGMLIAGIIPFGIGMGAMFCGIYYCVFQKMNGEKVTFEGLFKGFNYFVPALVATLIFIIPTVIFMILSYIPLVLMQIRMMNSKNPNPDEIFAYFGFFIVEMLVMWLVLGSIHAFLFFAYPLIVERGMSGLDAFKLSARAVWNNLSGVVGFILLEFALGFVGYLFCFVGVYFTLPIMFAGALVIYRKVFPNPGNQNFNPPPPDAFRGAGSYT
ncbi:MAG: hypothetical protein M3033_18620 [Acidobacteriota bacterium]|nr:hypothetical protein [Acidobacteriota bacterium]